MEKGNPACFSGAAYFSLGSATEQKGKEGAAEPLDEQTKNRLQHGALTICAVANGGRGGDGGSWGGRGEEALFQNWHTKEEPLAGQICLGVPFLFEVPLGFPKGPQGNPSVFQVPHFEALRGSQYQWHCLLHKGSAKII